MKRRVSECRTVADLAVGDLSIDTIYHTVATSTTRSLCAFPWRGGFVATYGILTRRFVALFSTEMELGASYHMAMSEHSDRLAVGAYLRHGVVCFDGATGERLWQRQDLTKVWYASFDARADRLAVGFDGRPCHILNAVTGETVATLRAVEQYRSSPLSDVALVQKRDQWYELLEYSAHSRLNRFFLDGGGLVDACFLPGAVVIAESGAPLTCVDMASGTPRWARRLSPPGSASEQGPWSIHICERDGWLYAGRAGLGWDSPIARDRRIAIDRINPRTGDVVSTFVLPEGLSDGDVTERGRFRIWPKDNLVLDHTDWSWSSLFDY